MNDKKNTVWMIVSGAMGLSFFLIANFTNLFTGSSIIAGVSQLAVNVFVFVVWLKAFLQSHGFKKFIAFVGTVFPAIMASITIWRVLLPAFYR